MNEKIQKIKNGEKIDFYHVQDIPGKDEPTEGVWDLRKNIDSYLGFVEFKDKTVLELGPASGGITFEMEKRGAKVKSIELPDNEVWDVVPNCRFDWRSLERKHRMDIVKPNHNAYWTAHEAHKSKAEIIYTHARNINSDLGLFDISILASVLLHIQNPVETVTKTLSITKEKLIITDILPVGHHRFYKFFPSKIRFLLKRLILKSRKPYLEMIPNHKYECENTWFYISPKLIKNIAYRMGFEKSSIFYHTQSQCKSNYPIDFFTIVCERTIPYEKCNY